MMGEWRYIWGTVKLLCSSQCWSCANTDSVMRYCMANHSFALALYDCVCDMDHETVKKLLLWYIYCYITLLGSKFCAFSYVSRSRETASLSRKSKTIKKVWEFRLKKLGKYSFSFKDVKMTSYSFWTTFNANKRKRHEKGRENLLPPHIIVVSNGYICAKHVKTTIISKVYTFLHGILPVCMCYVKNGRCPQKLPTQRSKLITLVPLMFNILPRPSADRGTWP